CRAERLAPGARLVEQRWNGSEARVAPARRRARICKGVVLDQPLWDSQWHATVGVAAVLGNRSGAEPHVLPHARGERRVHAGSAQSAGWPAGFRFAAAPASAADQPRWISLASAYDQRTWAALL